MKEVSERSKGNCEVCSSAQASIIYAVPPRKGSSPEEYAHLCKTCHDQIEGIQEVTPNHWRCLNDSMWSEVDAVKVISWRMLKRLQGEGWPNDLLEMMYLEEDILAWAKEGSSEEDQIKHLDSNGVELQSGDSVVLIKDLKVKGANFVAKRGTAVRNITLVHDNPEQIEGKVEGQRIVILTQYVKK